MILSISVAILSFLLCDCYLHILLSLYTCISIYYLNCYNLMIQLELDVRVMLMNIYYEYNSNSRCSFLSLSLLSVHQYRNSCCSFVCVLDIIISAYWYHRKLQAIVKYNSILSTPQDIPQYSSSSRTSKARHSRRSYAQHLPART